MGLSLSVLACGLATAAAGAPHIIHIMGDDIGWNDLSYHHGSLSHSPHLDALATGGVRLVNHHAFKVCGPSRSAFHTGRLPWQMGYYDNSGTAVPWLNIDSNRLGASLDFTLLPQTLRNSAANYTAHAVGKWHLGHVTRAYTPTYRGYASFLGYYNAMTEDYWAHTHGTGTNAPGGCQGDGQGGLWNGLMNNTGAALGHSFDNGTYESTLFGDQAVQLIERHDTATDGPLFLYLAFHNEHDPHQAPRSAIDRYGAGVRSDTYKITVAQIATMDEQVGRVVAALNASGMLDDAILSFSSDNGGPLDHANNYPRRGGKHGFYEGGIRTEAFVWSRRIPEARRGASYDGLMHLADWKATLAGGAVGLPPAQLDDGAPFADESHDHWAAILGEAPCPRRQLVHNVHSPAHYPGNCTIKSWGGRNCPAVITQGDLKYMVGYVGDARIVEMDEATNASVPFGGSGGRCGLGGVDERCDSPGKGKAPKPQPDDPGGCLHGCLFNVTADVGEKHNLVNHSQHAPAIAAMQAALAAAGAAAPPWFQAPQVANYSNAQLGQALCDAAHRADSVQPLDF